MWLVMLTSLLVLVSLEGLPANGRLGPGKSWLEKDHAEDNKSGSFMTEAFLQRWRHGNT